MNFHDYQGEYVIFGAGGLGRELWGWIKWAAHARTGSGRAAHERCVAFIDDHAAPGATYDGVPVRTREAFGARPVHYINAVGSAAGRAAVAASLAGQGWIALSYVDPSVICGVNLSIGSGVVVCPRSTLSSDATLHDHVLVNVGCGVGHDVVVGACSVLLGAVSLNGNVVIGERVTVGAGALVYPGRRVGDGATVGMGSAVFSHVKAGITVMGNPARRLET